MSELAKVVSTAFECPQPDCDWSGKSKSALTQHINKNHADNGLAALRADLGNMAPRPGGAWKTDRPLKAVPSGVPSIDYAIGIGGIPRGCLVEVFGPPKAGKTFVGLTFAAYAQSQGGRAGFTDAERALQPTFVSLVPGLDVDALEYGQARNGEQALNICKKFVQTGLFDVWVLDSLHACIPQTKIDADIGSSAAQAALARLLSEGLPVLEHVIADTQCVLVMINHEKTKPGMTYGNPIYTPGGSAPEYYSAVRLRVSFGERYKLKGSGGKVMGHQVKVKVDKSKVGPPGDVASYDLYYRAGVRADNNRSYQTGVDIGSCWLSVLMAEERIAKLSSGVYVDTESGERLGGEADVTEALEAEDNPLVESARKAVYPAEYA